MADERERDLERRAGAGDAQAEARIVVERLRAGSLDRGRIDLAAYLGDPGALGALELLEGSVEVPDDPEDWALGMLGHGQEADARVVLAAARPFLPALRLWLPHVDWTAARATLEAWCETHDPKLVVRYGALTESLGEGPNYAGEAPPAGADDVAVSLEPIRDALRSVLPEWSELPQLPPAVPWRDPGHGSRFPREPCDARSALYLLSDVIDDPKQSSDTAQCALDSVVREYGGRYGTELTQWARNCAFDSAAVHGAVWRAAYRTMGETIRAEVLPWCLGDTRSTQEVV